MSARPRAHSIVKALGLCVAIALATAVRAAAQVEVPTPEGVRAEDSVTSGTDATRAQDPQPPAENKRPKKKSAPKHPSFKLGDDITVSLTARVDTDARLATPAIGRDAASFDWEDRRVGIEGEAFKRFEFEISRELSDDFAEPREPAWRDVYVKGRVDRALSVTGGRFKEPFGREALTGEVNLDFVNRAFASRVLSPGRDTGVMAEGRFLDRVIEYQAGYFTRDGDNGRTSETQGGEDAFVARLVVAPFARSSTAGPWLAPLQVGVATASSRLDDRLGLRGRTSFGDGIFFDRVFVNGRRQRIGLEGAWEYGPVSVTTEYITVSDERKEMGFDSADLPDVRAKGWYVAGTWALTGERKHGRLAPRNDFLRGGFGAVELALRVEGLTFDTIDFPGSPFGFPTATKLLANTDRATTFGVNWYLNHYIKLQTNIVSESISDPDRGPSTAASGRFTSTVFRIQFRI